MSLCASAMREVNGAPEAEKSDSARWATIAHRVVPVFLNRTTWSGTWQSLASGGLHFDVFLRGCWNKQWTPKGNSFERRHTEDIFGDVMVMH